MPSSSVDPKSISDSARTLQPGEPVSSTLPTTDDRDYYAISVQAGLSYALTVTPGQTPYGSSKEHLTLVDASGADATQSVLNLRGSYPTFVYYPEPNIFRSILAPIAVGLYNPPITFTFAAISNETIYAEIDASYYGIAVLSGGVFPPSQYTVELGAPDDFGDTPATAGQLVIGGSVSGNLDVLNDVDEFAVALEAGRTYEFDDTSGAQLEMTLFGSNQDTSLAHWSPYHPALTYTPTQTGTYYLSLSTIFDREEDTISAKILDPPSSPPVQAGQPPAASAVETPASPPILAELPTAASAVETPSVPAVQTAQPATASATIAINRLFDATTGTQFLTADLNEATTLLATRPAWVDEGVSLQAASSSDPNATPVFRFFDVMNGSHFFTASTSERDTLLATQSGLTFEGVGFSEYSASQPNSVPVYRYFDTTNGAHFFTSSASELATVAATRPDLQSEGIAFFSPS